MIRSSRAGKRSGGHCRRGPYALHNRSAAVCGTCVHPELRWFLHVDTSYSRKVIPMKRRSREHQSASEAPRWLPRAPLTPHGANLSDCGAFLRSDLTRLLSGILRKIHFAGLPLSSHSFATCSPLMMMPPLVTVLSAKILSIRAVSLA